MLNLVVHPRNPTVHLSNNPTDLRSFFRQPRRYCQTTGPNFSNDVQVVYRFVLRTVSESNMHILTF